MIAIKYTIFVTISILFNLSFQYLSFGVYTGFGSLYVAMFVGTLAGLVVKYVLDKKFIFYHIVEDKKDDVKKFVLYSLMGVFTTIIFWGTEIAFDTIFQGINAKYIGAVIGLSVGYTIKYFLDKKYVFIHKGGNSSMSFISWGMYPKIKNTVFEFDKEETLKQIIHENDDLIPYGNGRSYGDSALGDKIIYCKPHNYFLDFDEESGILHCQSGVMLSEIIESFVPRGWFLKVTPGTKLITVGGAIASDVHGKNHHVEGCFSECVEEFNLMLPNGEIKPVKKGDELFKATCGGMGLTGVILDAKISLKKINSQFINQTTIKTKNLKETFDAFEKYSHMPYSVAWIDCLAKGEDIGKCLLMVGDFADDGDLNFKEKKKKTIPFNFPSFALNNLSVKAFNWLYYKKAPDGESQQKVDIDTFFYPLDAINNWNRIYGKGGFTQYQFILPKEKSYDGLKKILNTIANSGKGSFLAVLKLYGKANENYLSFPMEGYSLALDFKIEKGLFELLDRLDEIVLEYGGRIYLAKDVRVSKETFEKGYPNIEKFRAFRKENGMSEKFSSLQSKRVGV